MITLDANGSGFVDVPSALDAATLVVTLPGDLLPPLLPPEPSQPPPYLMVVSTTWFPFTDPPTFGGFLGPGKVTVMVALRARPSAESVARTREWYGDGTDTGGGMRQESLPLRVSFETVPREVALQAAMDKCVEEAGPGVSATAAEMVPAIAQSFTNFAQSFVKPAQYEDGSVHLSVPERVLVEWQAKVSAKAARDPHFWRSIQLPGH